MRTTLEYRLALGFAALATTGWLAVAGRQWLIRQRYSQAAEQFYAGGDGERARQALGIAGGRMSEAIIAGMLVMVFAVVAVALSRRTWNGWDWATAVVGVATVVSLVFLCAAGRVIYAAPFTLAPLWMLLYRPGVKASCGVGEGAAVATPDGGVEGMTAEVDVRQERETLTGLQQSLRVFEIERGLATETFVARYVQGLEEDSEDNHEWFALARLARRAEERIAASNGHPRS